MPWCGILTHRSRGNETTVACFRFGPLTGIHQERTSVVERDGQEMAILGNGRKITHQGLQEVNGTAKSFVGVRRPLRVLPE